MYSDPVLTHSAVSAFHFKWTARLVNFKSSRFLQWLQFWIYLFFPRNTPPKKIPEQFSFSTQFFSPVTNLASLSTTRSRLLLTPLFHSFFARCHSFFFLKFTPHYSGLSIRPRRATLHLGFLRTPLLHLIMGASMIAFCRSILRSARLIIYEIFFFWKKSDPPTFWTPSS